MSQLLNASASHDGALYYHITGRCVRFAYLTGFAGHYHYDHRRQWFNERLLLLSDMFMVEVVALAIQPRQYQLVLRLDPAAADRLDPQQIIARWSMLYQLPQALQTLPLPDNPDTTALLELWRNRLCDLSWFLRSLHHYIAKKANAEDGCSGHFWESRVKTKRLTDEQTLKNALASIACLVAEPTAMQ